MLADLLWLEEQEIEDHLIVMSASMTWDIPTYVGRDIEDDRAWRMELEPSQTSGATWRPPGSARRRGRPATAMELTLRRSNSVSGQWDTGRGLVIDYVLVEMAVKCSEV